MYSNDLPINKATYNCFNHNSTNADDNDGVAESDGEEELPKKAKLIKQQWHATEWNVALLFIVGKSTVHDK